MIVYTLRVNMSVAAPDMQDDLGWSDAEKGLILVRYLESACVTHINLCYLFASRPSIGDMPLVKFQHRGLFKNMGQNGSLA